MIRDVTKQFEEMRELKRAPSDIQGAAGGRSWRPAIKREIEARLIWTGHSRGNAGFLLGATSWHARARFAERLIMRGDERQIVCQGRVWRTSDHDP